MTLVPFTVHRPCLNLSDRGAFQARISRAAASFDYNQVCHTEIAGPYEAYLVQQMAELTFDTEVQPLTNVQGEQLQVDQLEWEVSLAEMWNSVMPEAATVTTQGSNYPEQVGAMMYAFEQGVALANERVQEGAILTVQYWRDQAEMAVQSHRQLLVSMREASQRVAAANGNTTDADRIMAEALALVTRGAAASTN